MKFKTWINTWPKLVEIEKDNGTLTSPPVSIPYLNKMVNNSKVLIKGCAGAGDQFISLKWLKELSKYNNKIYYFPNKHNISNILKRLDYIHYVYDSNYVNFKQFDYWCLSGDVVYTMNFNSFSDIPKEPHFPITNNKHGNKVGLKLWSNVDTPKMCNESRQFSVDYLFDILYPYRDDYEFYLLDIEQFGYIPDWINKPKLDYDWNETMNFISDMDLVISSCTGIAHLSSAMGIKTLIIIPIEHMINNNFWMWEVENDKDRYGGEHTWFYENTRLIKQQNRDDINYMDKIVNYIKEL